MKPRVFVSSTIRDFEDLRGALKYVLEDSGFQVLLSEKNDFEKPLEKNSYEACFEAIRQSNVYILLIGGRRGGWFDKENCISITQQEYRVAYETSKTKDLKIVIFVRKSVADLIE